MSLHYLDSSAWVKRYFNESGSMQLRSLFESQAALAGCRLDPARSWKSLV